MAPTLKEILIFKLNYLQKLKCYNNIHEVKFSYLNLKIYLFSFLIKYIFKQIYVHIKVKLKAFLEVFYVMV